MNKTFSLTTCILAFTTFFFSACEKELKIDIPEIEPKLVVNSIFTPDSIFKVYVSQTKTMLDTGSNYINNVSVELWEDDLLILDFLSNNKGEYSSCYHPKPPKKYEIKVNSNLFNEVKSVCLLPNIVKIDDAYFTQEKKDNSNEETEYVTKTTTIFHDPPVENYYEIILFEKFDGLKLYITGPYYELNDLDHILENEGDIDYRPTTFFFSDELFNGKKCQITIPGGGNLFWHDDNYEVSDIYVELRSVSKEYYLYRKYWTRHYFNQNNEEHLDDPMILLFQGEPIEMYTNIEGGYGIFAGYSQDVKKLRFEPTK